MFKTILENSNNGASTEANSGFIGTSLFESIQGLDTSILESIIEESEKDLVATVASYQAVMYEAVDEGAGEEVQEKVAGEASKTVGQKILAWLESVRKWIVKTFFNLVASVTSFVANIEKVMKALEAKVKQRVEQGKLKGFTVQLYEYKLDDSVISLSKLKAAISNVYKIDGNDISGTYDPSKDAAVKAITELDRNVIESHLVKQITSGLEGKNLKELKEDARKKLRGGGDRVTKPFTMEFFGEIKKAKDISGPIKAIGADLEKEIAEEMKQVKAAIKTARKNKKEQASEIQFYQARKRLLDVLTKVAATFNSLKVSAAIEEVSDIRKVCARALTWSPKQENAIVFNPVMDFLDESAADEDTGADDNLNESYAQKW